LTTRNAADAVGLHVHISDTAKKQFQIPSSTFPRPPTSTAAPSESDLEFHSTDSAFSFWITRRSTSEVIFDTRNHPFVFSDQLLELTTSIPDKNDVYGPGEIVSSSGFRRNPTKDKTTMWNRDAASPTDENMYGSHPFYISSSPGGSFGVFLLNSHGMDMVTQDRTMKYNVLGGTFDFYFLSGPTPMDVIRQYSEVVGKPARMPFWAFGFHMCRWGGDWKTPEGVKGVIQKMKDAGVPFETVWSDLDYMDGLRNFEAKPEWR
jgi:alpha-glucosidase